MEPESGLVFVANRSNHLFSVTCPQDTELAIGNGDGDLFIFKGKKKHAWKRSTGLGSISCLALGDMLGSGQNMLVVLTTEGYCHLFDVSQVKRADFSGFKKETEHESDKKEESSRSSDFSQAIRKHPSRELKQPPSHQSSHHVPHEHREDRLLPFELTGTGDGFVERPASTSILGPRADVLASGSSSNLLSQSSKYGEFAGFGGTAAAAASILSATISTGSSTSLSATLPGLTSGIPPSASTPSISMGKPVVHDDWVSNAPSQSGPGLSTSRATPSSSLLETLDDTFGEKPGSSTKNRENAKTDRLEAVYRWFVVGNGTCAIIADIDEDQNMELVIGTSNRVVYSYGIVHDVDAMGAITTKLKLKNKWNVPGQVGSLSLSRDSWGRPLLVIAQHGGNYTTIDHRGTTKYRQLGNPHPIEQVNAKDERSAPAVIRHAKRSNISPSGAPQDPVVMAMVGLDGSIMMQEENSSILWQRHVEHQLFALSMVDLTNDGQQEIVAASWDGMTYIFDQRANCVEFQVEERVAAFVAGDFSITKGNRVPCLAFVTFSDQILLYYNLPLKSIPVKSLVSQIGEQFDSCRNTKIDKGGPWTRSEQARLVKSLLDPSKFDESAAEAYKRSLERRLQDLNATS
jgi:hypothetical protein